MIDQRKYRDALGKFATGITVVTARRADGSTVGITVNSFNSVSLEPALVLWSIDKSSVHFETFSKAPHYVIHVLGAGQEEASRHFSGPDAANFDNIDFSLNDSGVPVLNDYLAVFECDLANAVDAGDHVILIGEVKKFDAKSGSALTYFDGDYGILD